jgi:alkylation response protein AidB-like acyl-CoA dehydrogenase
MLELSIALDELGRELAGGPFFASACLSVLALRNVATPDEQADLLPRLASGETIGPRGSTRGAEPRRDRMRRKRSR